MPNWSRSETKNCDFYERVFKTPALFDETSAFLKILL